MPVVRSLRRLVPSRLLLALALLLLAVPVAAAQEWIPSAATNTAKQTRDLFITISLMAIFVFVVVEVLLLYIIVRFRKNRKVPKNELHRGHTRAEIAWTIVPAVVLLFIGVLSAQAMESTDVIPKTDYTVKVKAFQWAFEFTYPDGSQSSGLYVQEGKSVTLELTSTDVIHAVWIPNFWLKLDAVPGSTTRTWFSADTVGNFALKCAEFCFAHPDSRLIGHHSMVSEVVVCSKADANCLAIGPNLGPVSTNLVDMTDTLQFAPPTIRVPPGTTVTWKNVGNVPHTVTPGEPGAATPNAWTGYTDANTLFMGGESVSHTFADAGEYPYYCQPHAPGMKGKVIVEAGAPPIT